MEPEQLAQFLNTVAQLLTDGGTHVYNATRQSVIVGVQRDITIYGAVCILAVMGCIYATYKAKTYVYSGRIDDSAYGWWIAALICGGLLVICGVTLIGNLYDLQRIDYLTLAALRRLVP